MSSFELPYEENAALSFGLDHYISSETDNKVVYAEFGGYYHSILHKLTNLPETKISLLYKKYATVKVHLKIGR